MAYLVSALILALAHLVALNWLCLGLPYWASLRMNTCVGVNVDVERKSGQAIGAMGTRRMQLGYHHGHEVKAYHDEWARCKEPRKV